MTSALSAYRTPSPPIAIKTSRLAVSSETAEARTRITDDLIDVEQLMMNATLNSRKIVLLQAVYNGIVKVEESFSGINENEAYLVADRVVRIFSDTTETRNNYVSRDHFLPRPIYFDQRAKVAYVYLRAGKAFPLKSSDGKPDVKFLKVTWNNGSDACVEKAFGIPDFE